MRRKIAVLFLCIGFLTAGFSRNVPAESGQAASLAVGESGLKSAPTETGRKVPIKDRVTGEGVKVQAVSEADAELVDSGTWYGINWSLDTNGKLVLEAYQEVCGSSYEKPEWLDYASQIISAEVKGEGGWRYAYALFSGCSNLVQVDTSSWDTRVLKSMKDMFSGCSSLSSVDVSNWDTGSVTDMGAMFSGCNNLSSIDVSGWDTGNVTDMGNMFDGCSSLNSVDVSNWDTGNVKYMNAMFSGCSSLNSVDVSNWDVRSVTDMKTMFSLCSSLSSVDVSSWDTGNVTNMMKMFSLCSSLSSVDVSNWDTGNVTSMGGMFSGCSSLSSVDVSNWDTGNITDMSSMFYGCNNLSSIDASSWDTGNVTAVNGMFYGCTKLSVLITLSGSIPDGNYAGCFSYAATEPGSKIIVEYTGSCTEEQARAIIATKLENSHVYLEGEEVTASSVSLDKTELALKEGEEMVLTPEVTPPDAWEAYEWSSDNPSVAAVDADGRVTAVSEGRAVIKITVGAASAECEVMVSDREITHFGTWYGIEWSLDADGKLVLEGSGEDYGNRTTPWFIYSDLIISAEVKGTGWKSANGLFSNCSNLVEIDTGNWETESVTDMCQMFLNCSSLTELDLNNWSMGNVTDMREMFKGCDNLNNLDVSNWETSSVTSMMAMFYGCSSLINLDINNWDTGNVQDMGNMFYDCRSLINLDINNWDTGNVQDMGGMFYVCSSLINLDINNWDTGNVKEMEFMFSNCSHLTSLEIDNWNTENVRYMHDMFFSCTRLRNISVENWDTRNVESMTAMFNGCESLVELKIENWNIGNAVSITSMFSGCRNLEILEIGTWDIGKARGMERIFSDCRKLSTFITLQNSIDGQRYENCFYNAATEPGSKIIVKYTGDCTEDLARAIVATKSENSHVYLEGEEVTASSVTLNKENLTLGENETAVLTPTVVPADAWEAYEWTSSDPSIATVDENGTVAAVAHGTATIKITVGSASAECQVTVDIPVSVTGITLDKTEITLTSEGAAEQLTAEITPENATNKKIIWSSTDETVAAVSETGLVTAIANGTSKIIAATEDGNKTAECEVTVDIPVSVTGITLDKTEITLTSEGAAEQLTAEITPENATNKKITWSSTDETVAAVSETGLVTAVANGTSTITAATEDGNKTAECQVTVDIPVSVTGIALDKTKITLTSEGAAEQLTAEITPENATNKKIIWSSTDETVATVSEMGLVTAIANGTSTITAATEDGNKIAECQVTVDIPVSVTGITLNKSIAILVGEGATEQLSAVIIPENATNQSVTWSSSDENVAAVDETGLVTAKAKGVCTVTAETQDGSRTAACKIFVSDTEVLFSGAWHGINWLLDANQKLTLEGAGEEYGDDIPEWLDYAELISEAELSGAGMRCTNKMFYGCSNLKEVDTGRWNSGSVTSMQDMFSDCSSLQKLDTDSWSMENVANVSGMFENCGRLSAAILLQNSLENEQRYSGCFVGAATEPGSKIIVTCAGSCTEELARAIVATKSEKSHVYLEGEEVTAAEAAFEKETLILKTGERAALIPAVTPADAWEAYTWVSADPSIAAVDENGMVTAAAEGVTAVKLTVGSASAECRVIVSDTEILSSGAWYGIDWRLGTDGRLVLEGQAEDYGYNTPVWLTYAEQILSAKVKVSGMKSAYCLFSGCGNLKRIDTEQWDTAQITNFGGMLSGCGSLSSVDVSGFLTGNAADVTGMFQNCSGLTELDLHSFDLQKVEKASDFLLGCTGLTVLHSPCNLAAPVELPAVQGYVWSLSNGTEVTALPRNLDHSVEITRSAVKEKEDSPQIITTTKDLNMEDVVRIKYIPYSYTLVTNNTDDENRATFSLEKGRLPEGLLIYPATGEIYGVPTEVGAFPITVKAVWSNPKYEPSFADLTVTVLDNTDNTVYAASDEGYKLQVPLGEETEEGSNVFVITKRGDQLFVSEGKFEEFVALWLNGERLTEYEDYTKEKGSTRITIRGETFENKADKDGTNTIAAEFRADGDSPNSLRRTAQNFQINFGESGNEDTGTENHNSNANQSRSGKEAGEGSVTPVIRMVDAAGKPIENITVELHSTPKTAAANQDGTVVFYGVESGQHTLIVKDRDNAVLASKSFELVFEDAFLIRGSQLIAKSGKTFTLVARLEKGEVTFLSIYEGDYYHVLAPNTGDVGNIRDRFALSFFLCSMGIILCIYGKKRR